MGTSSKALVSALFAVVVSVGLIATPSTAGECLRDLREIDLGKLGTKRFRDYRCSSSSAARPVVSLKFYRMSDMALSAILDGNNVPGISNLFQAADVVETPTLNEFRLLLSRYATREDRGGYFTLKAFVPFAGKAIDTSGYKVAPPVVGTRTIGGWFEYSNFDFPALDLARRPGNNTVSRPLTRQDLNNYKSSIAEYNKIVREGPFSWQRPFTDRYVELLKYISRDGMPENFIKLTRTFQGCGDFANVSFSPRRLLADAVVIENISSQAIRVDELRGPRLSETKLRPVSSFRSLSRAGERRLDLKSFRLEPGEKKAFIKRLTFLDGDDEAKRRLPPYTYGPELHVSTLVIDGERYKLSGNSANYLQLSMGSESGSCPYLVSWNERSKEWVSHGKVLHAAQGAGREMAETKVFEGFRSRFQLQEREAEVARIDEVFLDVETREGQLLRLEADHPKLGRQDERRVAIHWGELVEFEFRLPDWLREGDVVRSKLTLHGYYERYSTILARRAGKVCTPSARPGQSEPSRDG